MQLQDDEAVVQYGLRLTCYSGLPRTYTLRLGSPRGGSNFRVRIFRVINVLAEHIWYVKVCIGIVVGMDVGDLTF